MKWFVWCGNPCGGYGLRDLQFAKYLRKRGEIVEIGGHVMNDELTRYFPPNFNIPKRLVGFQELSALKKVSSAFLDRFDIVYGKFFHSTKALKIARGIGNASQKHRFYHSPLGTIIDNIMLKALKKCDLVISISPDETNWLNGHRIKLYTSSNFYDSKIYKGKRIKKDIDVLFVGRDDPIKNLRNLQKACIIAKRKLTIINNEWDKNKISGYYNRAKVVILPSFYETFGSVVLESLACGTPVICSENVTAGKILRDSVIITKTDPQSIAEALSKKPGKIQDLQEFEMNRVLKREHERIIHEKNNNI